MLGLVVSLPLSGEHVTKSRSYSDCRAGTTMDNHRNGCYSLPVRDAIALGHLERQVHPFGEFSPLTILRIKLIRVQIPFWMTAIFIDIVIDLALSISSAYSVLTMHISNHQKISATSLLSLRLM
jgi:hypothetical protein